MLVQLPFKFQGQFWVLKHINERELGTEFRVHGVALTRAGRELSKIVEIEPMPEFAQDLEKAFISKYKLQMVRQDNASPRTITVQKEAT